MALGFRPSSIGRSATALCFNGVVGLLADRRNGDVAGAPPPLEGVDEDRQGFGSGGDFPRPKQPCVPLRRNRPPPLSLSDTGRS